jgi:DNA-binding NarL/FixJ family response regulator
MGADHHALAFHECAGNPNLHAGLVCFRRRGERNYTQRERAVLAAGQEMIASLLGTALARFEEPSAAALPPRVRQVLACLLEGDSDKQIAVRLGISLHTANHYSKIIHRHFSVDSRATLLAMHLRWLRRPATPSPGNEPPAAPHHP